MIHRCIEKKKHPLKGWGLYAFDLIRTGELVIRDVGVERTSEEYLSLTPEEKVHHYQINDRTLFGPEDLSNITNEWFVNHSCEPNTWFAGPFDWTAIRDIHPGEEITFDYAFVWSDDIEKFEINPCLCGSKYCRGKMTGEDWKLPAVRTFHAGHIPEYMEVKISQMGH